MTHDERVYHHMYETNEGIAEQAERIASLEELVRDMMRYYFMPSTIDRKQRETELIERANELGVEEDDGELGVEVGYE